LIVVKPDRSGDLRMMRRVQDLFYRYRLTIVYLVKAQLPKEFWERFYVEHIGKDFFHGFTSWMASGETIQIVVEGEGRRVARLVRGEIVLPLRRRFQKDERQNALHSSRNATTAKREIGVVFGA
jgi:nucleoside diphosphate kinase